MIGKKVESSKIMELRKKVDLTKWTEERKKEYLRNIFVRSPEINTIIEAIDACRTESKYLAHPMCMCIVGEHGVGKSFLIENYTNGFPSYDKDFGDRIQKIVPVLHVKIPPNAKGNSIALSIRRGLGDPLYNNGKNVDERMEKTAQFLKDCGVQLVFLDEVQHIIERDSGKVIRESGDWIKYLIEKTMIPFVLVGLPSMSRIIDENEQLDGRFKRIKAIKPFSMDRAKDAQKFKTFLHVVDASLPFDEWSNLDDNRISDLLFEVSEGKVRVLMHQIILPAAIKAIDLNMPKISYGLLRAEAFEVMDKKRVEEFKKQARGKKKSSKRKKDDS